MKTTTIVSISVGTVVTGLVGMSFISAQHMPSVPVYLLIQRTAYAVYFDYRRRNDPEFRKQLKRESRRQARIAKEQAEQKGNQQREEIKRAVQEAIEEGFPTDIEEKEAFFMQQIAQGEALSGDGTYSPSTSCDARGCTDWM
jgi:hypothetical protein